tara:strand:+ start:214 stop:432 length:219 start_codon:yes stop_codon:yes gene_type:complete
MILCDVCGESFAHDPDQENECESVTISMLPTNKDLDEPHFYFMAHLCDGCTEKAMTGLAQFCRDSFPKQKAR